MESQGWREGYGLGRNSEGLSEALENDGQYPIDKTGFGYDDLLSFSYTMIFNFNVFRFYPLIISHKNTKCLRI